MIHRLASLPMYDWAEARRDNDMIWTAVADTLAAEGVDRPDELIHTEPGDDHWLDPRLLLSQTCGYPYATRLRGKVTLVATPVYDAPGCNGATYSSAVVVRRDEGTHDLHGTRRLRFAFNSRDSLSGYRCLTPTIGEPGGFFAGLLESGGHRMSAQWVAEGRADIAAIDCVCWHMLQRVETSVTDQLKVLQWTKPLPALPFISRAGLDESQTLMLYRALERGIGAVRDLLNLLPLVGVEPARGERYAALTSL